METAIRPNLNILNICCSLRFFELRLRRCFRSPDDPLVTQRQQKPLFSLKWEIVKFTARVGCEKTNQPSSIPGWVRPASPTWPMFLSPVELEELQHTASPPALAAPPTPPSSQAPHCLPRSPPLSLTCSTPTRSPLIRPLPAPTAVSTGPCPAWMPQTCTSTPPGGRTPPQMLCPHIPASMPATCAHPTSPKASA